MGHAASQRRATGERRKKRLEAIQHLQAFYCAPEDNGDFEDAEFGLGGIPPELLEQATDVLVFLEAIDWKWDINTLMSQPHDLFHAVMKLTVAGKKLKKQFDKRKGPENNA